MENTLKRVLLFLEKNWVLNNDELLVLTDILCEEGIEQKEILKYQDHLVFVGTDGIAYTFKRKSAKWSLVSKYTDKTQQQDSVSFAEDTLYAAY